jgi:PilZ domain
MMEQSVTTESPGKSQPFFMEHRWGQRIPCQAHVRLSASDGISGAGRVRDVSSSGAFIETTLELPVYARVALLVLGNESATRVVEITASVARVGRGGIGVEWCETPAGSICRALGCATRGAAKGSQT